MNRTQAFPYCSGVTHPFLRSLISTAAAVTILCGLGGCWSVRSGDPARLAAPRIPISAEHWPAREVEPLEPLLANTPSQVFQYRLADGSDPSQLHPEDLLAVQTPDATILDKGIFGFGLIRIFRHEHKPTARLEEAVNGFPPNARILTSRGWNDEVAIRAREQSKWGRTTYNTEASKGSGLLITGDAEETGLWSGVPVRIPLPEKGITPRGVVLHYHSIAPNPFEPAVVEEFERRGWLVISISTFATIRGDQRKGTDDELARISSAAKAMEKRLIAEVPTVPIETVRQRWADHPAGVRLASLRRQEAELRRLTFDACEGTDLAAVGARIAAQVDQQLAGNAYVGEAAVEFLYDRQPHLASLPLVVLGFSGGALAAPAAVARLGDRVDALIMVGGGADIFRLSQDSSLTDGGITIRCGEEKVDRKTLDAIHAAYLATTRLDPWVIAPALRGLPTLHAYGTWDRMVPTSAAERLNDRLGDPDRLVLRGGGHTLLFYRIPGRAAHLADWLDENL